MTAHAPYPWICSRRSRTAGGLGHGRNPTAAVGVAPRVSQSGCVAVSTGDVRLRCGVAVGEVADRRPHPAAHLDGAHVAGRLAGKGGYQRADHVLDGDEVAGPVRTRAKPGCRWATALADSPHDVAAPPAPASGRLSRSGPPLPLEPLSRLAPERPRHVHLVPVPPARPRRGRRRQRPVGHRRPRGPADPRARGPLARHHQRLADGDRRRRAAGRPPRAAPRRRARRPRPCPATPAPGRRRRHRRLPGVLLRLGHPGRRRRLDRGQPRRRAGPADRRGVRTPPARADPLAAGGPGRGTHRAACWSAWPATSRPPARRRSPACCSRSRRGRRTRSRPWPAAPSAGRPRRSC